MANNFRCASLESARYLRLTIFRHDWGGLWRPAPSSHHDLAIAGGLSTKCKGILLPQSEAQGDCDNPNKGVVAVAQYLVSYRLKSDSTYESRYHALINAINEAGSAFWESETSLVAMETTLSISALGSKLKATVRSLTDLIFIREIDVKNTAIIGDPGDAFFYFFPDAKKL